LVMDARMDTRMTLGGPEYMCGRKLRACFDPFPSVGKTGVLGNDFSR
jgi:hypothetical protein